MGPVGEELFGRLNSSFCLGQIVVNGEVIAQVENLEDVENSIGGVTDDQVAAAGTKRFYIPNERTCARRRDKLDLFKIHDHEKNPLGQSGCSIISGAA